VKPWESLAQAVAPDGAALELRRRDGEYLIVAGGYDLMSSADDSSSKALASLGLGATRVDPAPRRVLVGGLGMGFTLRAALDHVGPQAVVEVAELVPAVVRWNHAELGSLAGWPLRDARARVVEGDVRTRIRAVTESYDAILLDVDNGPDALAHGQNDGLYGRRGVQEAWNALTCGGVLAVWSFSDDRAFTARLKRCGFEAATHRVPASRSGRGRHHVIWVARKAAQAAIATRRRR